MDGRRRLDLGPDRGGIGIVLDGKVEEQRGVLASRGLGISAQVVWGAGTAGLAHS